MPRNTRLKPWRWDHLQGPSEFCRTCIYKTCPQAPPRNPTPTQGTHARTHLLLPISLSLSLFHFLVITYFPISVICSHFSSTRCAIWRRSEWSKFPEIKKSDAVWLLMLRSGNILLKIRRWNQNEEREIGLDYGLWLWGKVKCEKASFLWGLFFCLQLSQTGNSSTSSSCSCWPNCMFPNSNL